LGNVNLSVSVLAMTKGNVVQRLVHGYHNQNQVNIKIIRIFYVSSYESADGRVVSNFISFRRKRRDITILETVYKPVLSSMWMI
jgi:hypothetical protein